MTESDFIKVYTANAAQIMWFLGAGTSRTAGMPTATDLIWDLKLKYYCREENQDIKSHDINNDSIKRRVQSYMDSKGFPKLWSPEEYCFYFWLSFGEDYAAQQKYLFEQLNNSKISLNIGHRALAGIIGLNRAKLLFTTNFDEVIETACVKVNNASIPTYHLEGSYAALDALNAERFPIYSKIHGDFKYTSVKNLEPDLLSNDKEIQKCFLSASNRYGIIVTGYSGRDQNVMSMFYTAIEQQNAFPTGLYWTVPNIKDVSESVTTFIKLAQKRGVDANIIETGTFDSMLSKIWRQMPTRDDKLDNKVLTAKTKQVDIPMGPKGNSYPVVRMNALPISDFPRTCAAISTKTSLSNFEVKELVRKNRSRSIITRAEQILGWGDEEEIIKALGKNNVTSILNYKLENPIDLVSNRTGYHAFFERALAISLCEDKPLLLKNDKGFILTIDPKYSKESLFEPLKESLSDRNGTLGKLTGIIPNGNGAQWSEAISIKLENQDGQLWLMIRPVIWVEPYAERKNNIDFIKNRRRFRFNQITHKILNAWITILLGSAAKAYDVEVSCFKSTAYPAIFKINTRTAYSHK